MKKINWNDLEEIRDRVIDVGKDIKGKCDFLCLNFKMKIVNVQMY